MSFKRPVCFAVCLLLASLIMGLQPDPAAAQVPQFREFSTNVYTGRVRAPDLNSHPEAREYRTRLREAAKGKVNFAGEYILTYWGCGTTCLMGAAINARTGRVVFMPHTICCWFDENEIDPNPIDYKANSTLIIFKGLLDEEDPKGTHYFEFSGGEFHFLERQVAAADGQNTNDGGSATVRPSCPQGYVLSGNNCVKQQNAAPTPSCPQGYTFSNGGCVAGQAASPRPPRLPRPNRPSRPTAAKGSVSVIITKDLGVGTIHEMDGAIICAVENSPVKAAVEKFFPANNMSGVAFLPRNSSRDAIGSYQSGECDGLAVQAQNANSTLRNLRGRGPHMILPESIDCAGCSSGARPNLPRPNLPGIKPPRPNLPGTTAPRPNLPRPSLPQPQYPESNSEPPPSTLPLETQLQMQLKRIGCLQGSVDGIWGRGSRAALARFVNATGLTDLNRSLPTLEAIDAARIEDPGVCRNTRATRPNTPKNIVCGRGLVKQGNRCVKPNRRPQVSQKSCLARCDKLDTQCHKKLTRLGDQQGWDGDLRQDYWTDNCDPSSKSCRFACNPKGPMKPGECRFERDGSEICS